MVFIIIPYHITWMVWTKTTEMPPLMERTKVRDVRQLRNAKCAMCVFTHESFFLNLIGIMLREFQPICGALCRITHHHEDANLHNQTIMHRHHISWELTEPDHLSTTCHHDFTMSEPRLCCLIWPASRCVWVFSNAACHHNSVATLHTHVYNHKIKQTHGQVAGPVPAQTTITYIYLMSAQRLTFTLKRPFRDWCEPLINDAIYAPCLFWH